MHDSCAVIDPQQPRIMQETHFVNKFQNEIEKVIDRKGKNGK